MHVCCDRRVLSGSGLCDSPITRPEESYRLWLCLSMIEESPREGLGSLGLSNHEKKYRAFHNVLRDYKNLL